MARHPELEAFRADRARYPAHAWLRELSLWALALYRVGRWGDTIDGPRGKVLDKLYWPVYRLVEGFTGISLSKNVRVGPGCRIHHFGPIVVHDDAQIGANCTLRHGVTVGDRRPGSGVPVLEDDVELGAYAQVLGPVRIGRGAVVGALSLVLHDVPAGGVAVGNPARVLSRQSTTADAAG